jgi:hypothetical protein
MCMHFFFSFKLFTTFVTGNHSKEEIVQFKEVLEDDSKACTRLYTVDVTIATDDDKRLAAHNQSFNLLISLRVYFTIQSAKTSLITVKVTSLDNIIAINDLKVRTCCVQSLKFFINCPRYYFIWSRSSWKGDFISSLSALIKEDEAQRSFLCKINEARTL